MTVQNGTVTGVTLASANPAGVYGAVSGTNYVRKAYLCTVDFPAYTGSSDTFTVTGILTAVNAAVRDGRTRILRAAVCAFPGLDTNAQAVFAEGASVAAGTIANPTTTGDMSGNLTDAGDTELTSATASTGMGIMAFVDEAQ
jgi:flagellar hook-associated protein FlgK